MATESNQSEETNNVSNVFGKYKDRFQGIEKLNGILVDLNVDPEFEPVAQPPRCQLFSVPQKMKGEIQHLFDQNITEKVSEPT